MPSSTSHIKLGSILFNVLISTALITLFFTSFVWSTATAQNGMRVLPRRNEHFSVGALNSFGDLYRWALNEREIYATVNFLLESRPCVHNHHEAILQTEVINNYIQDFDSSILVHLQGLKAVSPNEKTERRNTPILSIDNYGELVASSLNLVYGMTHRFQKYGEALQEFISENLDSEDIISFHCNESVQPIFEERWPGTPENDMVILSILATYEMHNTFTNGDPDYGDEQNFIGFISPETKSPGRFTGEMQFAIGEMAVMLHYYVEAFDWLNEARWQTIVQGDASISRKFIDDTKENAVYRHNLNLDRVASSSSKAVVDGRFYRDKISLAQANTPMEAHWNKNKDVGFTWHKPELTLAFPKMRDFTMWALCSNRELQSEAVKARLKCYLDRKKHPWLFINPLRVEVVADYPLEILLFHDILGEQLMSRIVEKLDESEKYESVVGNSEAGESPYNFFAKQLKRSSVTSWIEDDAFPKLKHISEVATGLVASLPHLKNQAERFQAVEYVVGRHYTAHRDADPVQIETPELYNWVFENGGIRTATLLYYLNDVEKGGQTVFINARVGVAPKKGSAIFWFDCVI
ncbi:unnamed protein product [Orchesella dallaii]|uniref:Prolyl 4-hydroxylase alpha subunit domain-containing protein n=1 Tax=Orchesella dallaii TaxID=48710 RepID=A0ABP1QB77_9HEXA